jgi:hypothetical protein
MSAECGRVLVMVPGDRSGKLAAVPLVVSAAVQQPQPVVISVVSAVQQRQMVVVSVLMVVQQPQKVVTRMVI